MLPCRDPAMYHQSPTPAPSVQLPSFWSLSSDLVTIELQNNDMWGPLPRSE